MDRVRLSKTLAFLLRHRPEVGGLKPDEQGWVPLEEACRAASKLMRTEVTTTVVRDLVTGAQTTRFEVRELRIRALSRSRAKEKWRAPRRHPRCTPPDILYHATTAERAAEVRDQDLLTAGPERHVYLSGDEAHAWRVAHRLRGALPEVLVIDASRARRKGVSFFRNRKTGLYLSSPIPTSAILNLQEGYAEQHSAGGFPVRRASDGGFELALVKVTRRSGATWEVAKGKLEPGETPEATAIREVQEELGISAALKVMKFIDTARYGFLIPGGHPRLKSVYLYLLEPLEPIEGFTPRASEGISDVAWFPVDEAVRAVTHSSLQPVMKRVAELLRDPSHR
ncbi:MAG: NUDIX domain-containing protein [Deltaproteobacteria bacterium]|nr:MAG: NUDIX domain-containing protein [Deltaproteobacteria bacterium]